MAGKHSQCYANAIPEDKIQVEGGLVGLAPVVGLTKDVDMDSQDWSSMGEDEGDAILELQSTIIEQGIAHSENPDVFKEMKNPKELGAELGKQNQEWAVKLVLLIQRSWRTAIMSTRKKISLVDRTYWECKTEKTTAFIPPHVVFSSIERAVMRNLAAWAMEDGDGWITLPGPAAWWPSTYDMKRHGFVPDESTDEAKGAYKLITTRLTSENIDCYDRLYEGVDRLGLKAHKSVTQF